MGSRDKVHHSIENRQIAGTNAFCFELCFLHVLQGFCVNSGLCCEIVHGVEQVWHYSC